MGNREKYCGYLQVAKGPKPLWCNRASVVWNKSPGRLWEQYSEEENKYVAAKTLERTREIGMLTWFDTKICTGPASAKKPICMHYSLILRSCKILNWRCILHKLMQQLCDTKCNLWNKIIYLVQNFNRQDVYLVHHGHHALQDFTFKWAENHALVLHRECHKACSITNEALADGLHSSHCYHKPMPSTGPNK